LNKDAVRVLKVKGASPVAMRLEGVNQLDSVRLDSPCNCVDILWTSNDEPNVMDTLNRPRLLAFRKLVNGKIVRTGSQINVVGVRLPLDSHVENRAVELDRFLNIPDADCDVTKA